MKRKRDPYQGRHRHVEDKKKTFKQAVGKIMLKDTFRSPGVNQISREAGVSKSLIYRYFGSCKNLIEQYSHDIDFWMNIIQVDELEQLSGPDALRGTLAQQFSYIAAHPEAQRLAVWKLLESNYHTEKLLKKREEIGEHILFKRMEEGVENDVDFRAVSVILLAATCYIAIYASVQKETFCGIDLAEETGKKRIWTAMDQIIDSACKFVRKK